MSERRKILARVVTPESERVIEVTGQCARALQALYEAGLRGVTALECGGWAFRLAAYVHALRRDFRLVIRTDLEEHEGGRHARYILVSPVELLSGEATEDGDAPYGIERTLTEPVA